jgi:DNA-binding transcriptional ArsR family regulator
MDNEHKQTPWRERQDLKWTKSAFADGYTVLPHNLFRCLGKLGLRPTQQTVLFHLLDFWFDGPDTNKPVSKGELAERIGMDKRQVQRHLRSLQKAGLIESWYPDRPGLHAKVYSFKGLTKKLDDLSVLYRQEKKLRKFREENTIRRASKYV